LLGEDGEGLATGGAADALPVFRCVVDSVFADAFWVAGTAAIVLFADRLPSGAVESSFCFASEAVSEAAAAFFLEASLDAEPRTGSEDDSFGLPPCPVVQRLGLEGIH